MRVTRFPLRENLKRRVVSFGPEAAVGWLRVAVTHCFLLGGSIPSRSTEPRASAVRRRRGQGRTPTRSVGGGRQGVARGFDSLSVHRHASLGMMNHTSKIAVTVPSGTLRSVEVTRRRLGRSRSSIVTEALNAWLAARSASEGDRAYLAGYERVPEPEEPEISAAIMATWDTWDAPPAPRPKSEHRPKRRKRKRP